MRLSWLQKSRVEETTSTSLIHLPVPPSAGLPGRKAAVHIALPWETKLGLTKIVQYRQKGRLRSITSSLLSKLS